MNYKLLEGWKPYAGCPSVPQVTVRAEITVNGKKQVRFHEDASVLNRIKDRIHVPYDAEKFSVLETYIQTMIHARYSRISIRSIFTNSAGHWYLIDVMGDGYSYCMNLDRNHKNNNIYFYMKKEGIYQKCSCTCQTTSRTTIWIMQTIYIQVFVLTKQLHALFFKMKPLAFHHHYEIIH